MDEDGFFCRSGWAEKSGAASRREETAVKAFDTARLEMESRDDLSAGSRESVQLLKPSCPLTQACWKSFRGHVQGFEGWTTRRRVATEEEKKKHGEKRKSAAYFTEITYTVPRNKRELDDVNESEGDSSSSEGSDDFEAPVSKRSKEC